MNKNNRASRSIAYQLVSSIFLLFPILLGTPLAQADQEFNTKFSEPGTMCFPQTSLRAEPNKFSNIMLDHYLIVSKEDHFKGGVYVGFRLKSQPDELWLFDGANWVKRSDSDSPSPFIPREYGRLPTGQLQPIMHTFVSNYQLMLVHSWVMANYG